MDYVVPTLGFLLQIFDSKTGNVCTFLWDGNEGPDDSGDGEEGRCEEEAVVVSELGDSRGRSDGGGGTSDFIEYMLEESEMSQRAVEYVQESTYDRSVHPSQLCDVPTNDVTRTVDGMSTSIQER